MNFISSNWLAVQIVPFCDLNKLPPTYCLVTRTLSASGKVVVLIVFSPMRATHSSYRFDVGAKTTTAYSLSVSRYIGDGNETFVGIVPSVDVTIWDGSNTTSAWFAANNSVGVPNSTVLTWTVTFSDGSTFAKNKSTAVRNAPVSSTVNDCAKGSFLPPLLLLNTGLKTLTLCLRKLSTNPLASYVVSPLLINKLPFNGVAFVLLDVSLNVFVPTVNLNGGNGVVNGSLKNNAPLRSPKVSGINFTLETVACDPLVSPSKVIPSVTNPKYLPMTSSTKEFTSIFKIVEEDEYTDGNSTLLS